MPDRSSIDKVLGEHFDEHAEEVKACIRERLDEFMQLLSKQYDSMVKESVKESVKELEVCENPDQERGVDVPHPRIAHKVRPKIKERPVDSYSEYLNTKDHDNRIANCIGKAMRHAERVAKREHIMADRVERVNQFITSLRREFSYLDHTVKIGIDLAASMCRKEVWYDIGVLNLSWSNIYGGKFGKQQIQFWLDEAKKLSRGVEAARYQIESDLEELERGLTGCLVAVEDAKRVNQESESVSQQLCKLFE